MAERLKAPVLKSGSCLIASMWEYRFALSCKGFSIS